MSAPPAPRGAAAGREECWRGGRTPQRCCVRADLACWAEASARARCCGNQSLPWWHGGRVGGKARFVLWFVRERPACVTSPHLRPAACCGGTAEAASSCWGGAFTKEKCCGHAALPARGDPQCWNGIYSYQRCCATPAGPADESCWGPPGEQGGFTPERCCGTAAPASGGSGRNWTALHALAARCAYGRPGRLAWCAGRWPAALGRGTAALGDAHARGAALSLARSALGAPALAVAVLLLACCALLDAAAAAAGPPRTWRERGPDPRDTNDPRREDRKAVRVGDRVFFESRVPCWLGFHCRRAVCVFTHPDGRRVDGDESPQRRKSWSPRRPRSSPKRPRRSPRRQRARSRSRSARRWAAPGSRASAPARRASSSSSSASSPSASPASSRSSSQSGGGPAGGASPAAPEAGSFREFVRTLEDSTTPEDAVAEWKKHQEKLKLKERLAQEALVEQGLEKVKGTSLFFDSYHPLAAVRIYDLRVRCAQRRAELFVKSVQENLYDGLHLSTAAPGTGAREGATCLTAGHMKAPHFAFDPDVNGLVFSEVPPRTSIWAIRTALERCPGFLHFYCSEPAPKSLAREVRASFATVDDAQAALSVQSDSELAGAFLKTSRLSPASSLSALVAPPEMSLPDRICKDEALSAQAVRLLDELAGVPSSVTDALLSTGVSQESGGLQAKLDLQVLYLRRVHHFCFYAAEWCSSEWDLFRNCGAVMLRDALPNDATGVTPGPWTDAHEQRLAFFLTTAQLVQPAAMSEADRVKLDKTIAETVEKKTEKISEGKYKCVDCGKLFRGPDFVQKHLRKAHTDIFEAIKQDIYQEAACEAFRKNPIRASGFQ
ncbi:unnamed protein product [Prorocentrum cordatum]|uniref:C2H2-type domain-containing protein n=1 Tax=Prorocentrum cordatum TaxID=2364126 RepID=A0ABN9VYR5_9DINO|nr:unnamed protein product [Polarella glacialis]